MQSDRRIHINPLITIIIVIQLLFIGFVIVTVSMIIHQKSDLASISINSSDAYDEESSVENTITGQFSSAKEITEDQIAGIERVLYQIVSMNTTEAVPDNGAVIREDSLHYAYIPELKLYLLHLIIDIPEIGQSYHYVNRWSEVYPNDNAPSDNPAIIYCLYPDELIYGDFNCKDAYNYHGEDLVVFGLLRNKTFDSFTVGLLGDVYNGEPLSLVINTSSNDELQKEAAIAAVSDYLSVLGFDINRFQYTAKAITAPN